MGKIHFHSICISNILRFFIFKIENCLFFFQKFSFFPQRYFLQCSLNEICTILCSFVFLSFLPIALHFADDLHIANNILHLSWRLPMWYSGKITSEIGIVSNDFKFFTSSMVFFVIKSQFIVQRRKFLCHQAVNWF